MAPELDAPSPDERAREGPRDADNPDDLELTPHASEQTQPQAQLMQRLLRSHQGPLPSPEAFASYEQTVPGAGDRILRLAEEEATHRRSQEIVEGEHGRQLEPFDVRQAAKRQEWGLIFGGIMGTVITGAAIVIALLGNTIAAATIITTTVVSVTGIYVLGSRWRRQEQAPLPTDHEEHTD